MSPDTAHPAPPSAVRPDAPYQRTAQGLHALLGQPMPWSTHQRIEARELLAHAVGYHVAERLTNEQLPETVSSVAAALRGAAEEAHDALLARLALAGGPTPEPRERPKPGAPDGWPVDLDPENPKDREIARLRALLDRDATGLAAGLAGVVRNIDSYSWLCREGEWGSYDYTQRTEATLRREVRDAFSFMHGIAGEALRESGRRAFAAFHPAEAARLDGPALASAPSPSAWTPVGDGPGGVPPDRESVLAQVAEGHYVVAWWNADGRVWDIEDREYVREYVVRWQRIQPPPQPPPAPAAEPETRKDGEK